MSAIETLDPGSLDQSNLDQATLNAAGEWLLELQSSDVAVERIAAWQRWLGANERHARAFDQIQQTWGLTDALAERRRNELPWPSAEELRADHDGTESPGDHAPAATSASRRPPLLGSWLVPSSLAASVLAATILAHFSTRDSNVEPMLQTTIGEHREMHLSDGSIISVGPGSRLHINLERDRRIVKLDSGEAFFNVAKDPQRPFSVQAAGAAVTAVGTAFNIRRTGERLVVGVSEGVVAISPQERSLLSRMGLEKGERVRLSARTQLVAGQRMVVEPEAQVPPKVETVAAREIASWREGKLQYAGEPLGSIVTDINRYLSQPIEIDAAAAPLRVTGTVSKDNIESWLTSLQAVLPVRVCPDEQGRLRISRSGR